MTKQKEHKKSTLMRLSKEQLVDYVIMLEHNIITVDESFDNQYQNCLKMIDDMKLLNKTYFESKELIEDTTRINQVVKEQLYCSPKLTNLYGSKFFGTTIPELMTKIHIMLNGVSDKGIISSNFKANIDIVPCEIEPKLLITVRVYSGGNN